MLTNTNYPLPQTTVEVDSLIDKFTDSIVATIKNYTKDIPIANNKFHDLPEYILVKIKHRRTAIKFWRATGFRSFKALANRLQKDMKRNLNTLSGVKWKEKLLSLTPKNNSTWDMVRSIKNTKKRAIPRLRGKGGWDGIDSPSGKSDLLADLLEGTFGPTTFRGRDDLTFQVGIAQDMARTFSQLRYSRETPENIHWTEVSDIIRNIKKKKAPGDDTVNATVLKNLPPNYVVFLTDIINACWRMSYFPRAWKKAVIVSIPKPGKDVHDPASYRPISLLPVSGKVFENVMLRRFLSVVEEKALIPNFQFGFRDGHSCNLQLLRKVEYILPAWNKRTHTAVFYFDTAKAFDSVWHYGLVWKLIRAGFPAAF